MVGEININQVYNKIIPEKAKNIEYKQTHTISTLKNCS